MFSSETSSESIAKLRATIAERTNAKVVKLTSQLLDKTVRMAVTAGIKPEQIPSLITAADVAAADDAAQSSVNGKERKSAAGFDVTQDLLYKNYNETRMYEESVASIKASAAKAAILALTSAKYESAESFAFGLAPIRYGVLRRTYKEAEFNGATNKTLARFKSTSASASASASGSGSASASASASSSESGSASAAAAAASAGSGSASASASASASG